MVKSFYSGHCTIGMFSWCPHQQVSIREGVYFSQTTVIYHWLGLSLCPYYLLQRGFQKVRVGCTCTCLNPFTPNIHLQVLHSQFLVEVNLREDLNSNSFTPSSPRNFTLCKLYPDFIFTLISSALVHQVLTNVFHHYSSEFI